MDVMRSKNKHAVEMVGLVLRHARREVLQRNLHGLAFAVERAHGDVGVARHHAADVRDAEAAFPALGWSVADGHDLRVDDGDGLGLGPGSSSSSATKIRRSSCTCGPARPTPWYSCIVSIMSSISFCRSGCFSSAGSTGRARARSTGWPMRATFRMDMKEDYRLRACTHTTSTATAIARCAPAASKPGRSRPPSPSGWSACAADSSSISTRKWRWAPSSWMRKAGSCWCGGPSNPATGSGCFPGGYVDRGEQVHTAAVREAREEAGLDIRLDKLVNIYSYPGRAPVIIVYAASILGRHAGVRRRGPGGPVLPRPRDPLGRAGLSQHRRGAAGVSRRLIRRAPGSRLRASGSSKRSSRPPAPLNARPVPRSRRLGEHSTWTFVA